jgi:hypothetical protein
MMEESVTMIYEVVLMRGEEVSLVVGQPVERVVHTHVKEPIQVMRS